MPVIANPASRILSLALLTILVNTQGWQGMLIFMLPLILLFYRHPVPGRQALMLARRIRWFFLSILILYLWFYPGTALIPLLGRFSPTAEGVNEAVLRISSLLIVISYSVMLVQLTPREQIISGIQTLLLPLTAVGVNTSRFALRLGLVLAIVPELMTRQSSAKGPKNTADLSAALDRAAVMVKQASEPSDDFALNEITVAELSRPGALDIIIPLALLTWLLMTRFY